MGEGSTETEFRWYDSHVGKPCVADNIVFTKKETINLSSVKDSIHPLQYTQVPNVFNEWYFICATYNPNVNEIQSITDAGNSQNPYFWLNNVNNSDASGNYTHSSGFGNRSKIEIISKTDLLRARGYRI